MGMNGGQKREKRLTLIITYQSQQKCIFKVFYCYLHGHFSIIQHWQE